MSANCVLIVSIVLGLSAGEAMGEIDIPLEIGNPQVAIGLLRTELVQSDLKLTPAQIDKINRLKDSLNASSQDVSNRLRKTRREDQQKEVAKAFAPTQRQLGELLLPDQLRRLRELLCQYYGPYVFDHCSPEVAKRLALSHQQEGQIGGIVIHAQREVSRLLGEMGDPFQSPPKLWNAKYEQEWEQEWAAKKQAMDDIDKVLSPQQRKLLMQMKGAEINTRTLNEQLRRLHDF